MANIALHVLSLTSIVCLAFLAAVGHCIYNRYFHPLRKYIGPIGASLTDLYKVYALWVKHIPTSQLALHRRYGSVVRVAPNMLSISDPRMLPEVHHRYADKSGFYTHGIMGGNAPTFQTLDHREHAIRRKIIAPTVRPVGFNIWRQQTVLMAWKNSFR